MLSLPTLHSQLIRNCVFSHKIKPSTSGSQSLSILIPSFNGTHERPRKPLEIKDTQWLKDVDPSSTTISKEINKIVPLDIHPFGCLIDIDAEWKVNSLNSDKSITLTPISNDFNSTPHLNVLMQKLSWLFFNNLHKDTAKVMKQNNLSLHWIARQYKVGALSPYTFTLIEGIDAKKSRTIWMALQSIGLFTKKGFISPEISLSDPRIRKVLHSESKQVKTDIIKCLKSHLSPPPLSEIPPHDDPFPFSIVYYPPSKNLNFGVRQSFVCWDYYQSPQNAIPKYRFNPINPILFQTGYPHTNQINQMPQSIRTLFNIRIG